MLPGWYAVIRGVFIKSKSRADALRIISETEQRPASTAYVHDHFDGEEKNEMH